MVKPDVFLGNLGNRSSDLGNACILPHTHTNLPSYLSWCGLEIPSDDRDISQTLHVWNRCLHSGRFQGHIPCYGVFGSNHVKSSRFFFLTKHQKPQSEAYGLVSQIATRFQKFQSRRPDRFRCVKWPLLPDGSIKRAWSLESFACV